MRLKNSNSNKILSITASGAEDVSIIFCIQICINLNTIMEKEEYPSAKNGEMITLLSKNGRFPMDIQTNLQSRGKTLTGITARKTVHGFHLKHRQETGEQAIGSSIMVNTVS